jgi:predicted nucleotidyltransferase
MIELVNETKYPQANEILRGVIGLLTLAFRQRVRAVYLMGSYHQETAVSRSDLDLLIIFKGRVTEAEQNRCRQLGRYATRISPIRIDVVPRGETQLRQTGLTGAKLSSLLLFGDDIVQSLPWEPLSSYLPQLVAGCSSTIRELRGNAVALSYPLVAPDPADEFLGYTRFGWYTGLETRSGTRNLVNWALLAATTLVVWQSGQRVSSKKEAIQLYRTHIGDEWGDFLAELFTRAKMEWAYGVPETAEGRQQLRKLCQQNLLFETFFWGKIRPYLRQQLSNPDPALQMMARQRLQEIVYEGNLPITRYGIT